MNNQSVIKLVVILLFAAIVSCNSNHKKTKSTKQISQDSIIVSNDNSDIKVNYPITNYSLLDDSIQINMNKLVYEFEKVSNSISDTFDRPYQMIVNNEYSKSYKKYLSVLFSVYQNTGGAHGNTFFKSYLYNHKEGKLLYLKDIIPKGTFGELRRLVREKLNAKLSFKDFIDEGTESLADFDCFMVTDTSVVFIFQPYDVAPFSEGSQKVEILNSEFPFLLNE